MQLTVLDDMKKVMTWEGLDIAIVGVLYSEKEELHEAMVYAPGNTLRGASYIEFDDEDGCPEALGYVRFCNTYNCDKDIEMLLASSRFDKVYMATASYQTKWEVHSESN